MGTLHIGLGPERVKQYESICLYLDVTKRRATCNKSISAPFCFQDVVLWKCLVTCVIVRCMAVASRRKVQHPTRLAMLEYSCSVVPEYSYPVQFDVNFTKRTWISSSCYTLEPVKKCWWGGKICLNCQVRGMTLIWLVIQPEKMLWSSSKCT